MMNRRLVGLLILTAAGFASRAQAGDAVKVEGYLEFKKAPYLIVDAQRIEVTDKTKLKAGKFKKPADLPLGYLLRATGTRAQDGTIVATRIEARANGREFMEEDIINGTNQAEKAYVQARKVADSGPDGEERVIGALIDSGPQVDRARKIVDRLLPSYVDPGQVRVYVVDNREWNAMAMANYSIYVFSGLMSDMDDDELAIVLGHEIAHATYEHSRRQAKTGLIGGVAGQAAQLGADLIKSDMARAAAQQATAIGVTTFGNVYSREYEDQADRVGLRYVYEAGYDYRKAPDLWRKFAAKYGDQDAITNFFFGDHSLSTKRAEDLEKEIARNYSDPKKDPPTHATPKAG
jgi:Zn-dependent protease with chaperone function